jgi:hypothetical protein
MLVFDLGQVGMENISSVLMGGSSFFDMAQGWVMGVGWVGDGGAVFLLRWWFLSRWRC